MKSCILRFFFFNDKHIFNRSIWTKCHMTLKNKNASFQKTSFCSKIIYFQTEDLQTKYGLYLKAILWLLAFLYLPCCNNNFIVLQGSEKIINKLYFMTEVWCFYAAELQTQAFRSERFLSFLFFTLSNLCSVQPCCIMNSCSQLYFWSKIQLLQQECISS